MTYTLNLDGLALHHYGQGVYGWGPISSTTGQPGRLVEWTMRCEVESWIQARAVFSAGAVIVVGQYLGSGEAKTQRKPAANVGLKPSGLTES